MENVVYRFDYVCKYLFMYTALGRVESVLNLIDTSEEVMENGFSTISDHSWQLLMYRLHGECGDWPSTGTLLKNKVNVCNEM